MEATEATLSYCDFESNQGRGPVAAIGNGIADHCRFADNTSEALFVRSGMVEECLFANNVGGLFCEGSITGSLDVTGCTFAGNETFGMVLNAPFQITVSQSIVAFNQVPIICTGSTHAPQFTCCDVFGNSWGNWDFECPSGQANLNGNFSADPLFVGAGAEDYRLLPGSPCAPGHHPNPQSSCGLIGSEAAIEGPSPVTVTTWGEIKARFR